jgi:hypothetical protein
MEATTYGRVDVRIATPFSLQDFIEDQLVGSLLFSILFLCALSCHLFCFLSLMVVFASVVVLVCFFFSLS